MSNQQKKLVKRQKRHWRIRKILNGTSERPRLSIYRSLKHIYAQVIDDTQGQTLCSVSTLSPEIKKSIKGGGNIAAAKEVGKKLSEMALKKSIQKVAFDRSCFPYHGRIKALAESARESGLKF
ncbi:MAG: 50S ribosomal protein L18 [Planctomycetota bacterium]